MEWQGPAWNAFRYEDWTPAGEAPRDEDRGQPSAKPVPGGRANAESSGRRPKRPRADLPPPVGRRPVVLLSRDEAYTVRELVTSAPVTTRVRGLAVEVPLGPKEGLPKACAANLDTITTIPMAALKEFVALLSTAKRKALDSAIQFALGIDDDAAGE